jgi:hypothetical protein
MAKPRTGVRRDIGPLSLRASISPSSLDEEKRTVEVVWTTGARVMRGYFERFYEELSLDPKHVRMGRLQNGAPLLDSHNGYSLNGVLGVVESARLETSQGVATVRFARDEAGDAVMAKVKDGILRKVSVGYRTYRLEKIEDGEETIPVYLATDWEPFELSILPLAADDGAGVRSAGAETNPCEFVAEERHMPKMKKKPQGTAAVRAAEAEESEETAENEGEGEEAEDDESEETAETETAAADGESDDAGEESGRSLLVRTERSRISGIHRIARTLDVSAEVTERHVNQGTSLNGFRTAALALFAKAKRIETGAGGARIEGGQDARDKWLRGAEDWLFLRSGTDRLIAEHAKARGETRRIDAGEFRGMSMLDLARQSLERIGVRASGLSKPELIAKALTYRAGGYHTTSDFPVLLEGATNRVLLAAYEVAPDTWRLFARKGSVSDFRPHYRIRQGTFGRLDKVNEHGEFKNKPITDGAQEAISAETRGNIVSITRQALINDDLGALSSMAAPLGRAAKLSIEIGVYELLAENAGLGPVMADGNTLYHADHNNIGEGSVLTVEGLGADMVLMAQQMDQDANDFLDIRPKVLLVPLTLELKAIGMVAAEFDVDAADGVTPNPIRNLFPTIVGSPRITGTRRYVFADPDVVPTIEVVFLDGNETPYLETQNGWRIDGVEWKVRLDVGAGAVDWRGTVTNDGEA